MEWRNPTLPILFLILLAALASPSPSPTALPPGQQTTRTLEDQALELRDDYRDLLQSLAPTGLADGWLVASYRDRFERLADRGSLRAAAWLLQSGALGADPEALARRRALYDDLAAGAADAPWILAEEPGVLRALRADARRLGREAARDLAQRFRSIAGDDDARAAALLAEAEAELAANAQPRARRRALALLRRLLGAFPGTPAAVEARDAAWRLEHLVPGTVAPDFVARDVDGNEVRLSELFGRPVIVTFWGLEEARRVRHGAAADRPAPLETWTRWLEDREAADVVLLGVHLGEDERAFRRARAEHGVDWPTVIADPAADEVPWSIRRGPATVVLDRRGVLRFATFEADFGPSVPGALESVLARLARPPGEAPAAEPPELRRPDPRTDPRTEPRTEPRETREQRQARGDGAPEPGRDAPADPAPGPGHDVGRETPPQLRTGERPGARRRQPAAARKEVPRGP